MSNLQVIEFKSQRVLTTQQLAQAYETESNNIVKNFSRNAERFIEGRDYFLLQGDDLKQFKDYMTDSHLVDKRTPSLYLWTSRGANRHSKILDTDKAWQQFDILEETYFQVKSGQVAVPQTFAEALRLAANQAEQIEQQTKQIAELTPKGAFYDDIAGSKDAIEIGEAAKVLNKGIGRNKLFQILRDNKVLMSNNQPYQQYVDRGYFRVIEQKYAKPNGDTNINIKTLVYQRGLDYIRKLIEQKGA
jgi:phage antirepressor YoqD-like protein